MMRPQMFTLPAPLLLVMTAACGALFIACGTHGDHTDHEALRQRRHAAQHTSDSIGTLVQRDPAAGLAAARSFHQRSLAVDDSITIQIATRTLGFAHLLAGNRDSAHTLALRSIAMARTRNDSTETRQSLVTLGHVLTVEEKADSTLLVLEEAMKLVDPARDSSDYAAILANQANVYSDRGDFREATRILLLAVRYFEALGDKSRLAVTYGNLGFEYNKVGNPRSAIPYLKKAIDLNTELHSATDLVRDLTNLGVSYEKLEQYDSARAAFETALTSARQLGLRPAIAQALLNIGNVLAAQGALDEAATYCAQSMAICREEQMTYGIIMNLQVQAQLQMRAARPRDAISPLLQALELARQLRIPDEQLSLHEDLSTAYEDAGLAAAALRHMRQAQVLRDSLYGGANEETFKRLQAEFDLELTRSENAQLQLKAQVAELAADREQNRVFVAGLSIALLAILLTVVLLNRRTKVRSLRLLEEQKAIIERTSEQLAESNRLKELLLDVITHDLIGPVSTISGTAELLREQQGDPRLLDIISRSSARVADVAGMAAALSRVVVDEEIPRRQLRVADLVAQVEVSFRDDLAHAGMVLESHIPDDLFIHAHPVILEVLENYVSNSIRYASMGGRVIIDGFRDKKGCTLRVTDYGTTIPAEHRATIFTRRLRLDAATSGGSGLGLAIVARIMHAHGGTAWVEPNAPDGNIFCVRLPHTHLHA
jgi:signal transduction histidine kinase